MGLFLMPSRKRTLIGALHDFTFFVLNTEVPYIQDPHHVGNEAIQDLDLGIGISDPDYLSKLSKAFPSNYNGPFCIGVTWTKRTQSSWSLQECTSWPLSRQHAKNHDSLLIDLNMRTCGVATTIVDVTNGSIPCLWTGALAQSCCLVTSVLPGCNTW